MGTTSKGNARKCVQYKSIKSIKQWCKARGIDFKKHMAAYRIKLSF